MLDDADYNNIIADNTTLRRWRQIKGIFKSNNNLTTPGRGKEGYDPAAKKDLIFCTLCHNMNYFMLWAELDNAADESTWGFGGYMGNARGWLMNKLVGKGGQTTMLFDMLWRYPQAYVHRHKMHVQSVGFTVEGMFKIKTLIDQVEKLVVENAPDKELDMGVPPPTGYSDPMIYRRRRVYSRSPHITCNNHFLGDNVLNYAGQKGFGITQTCRQD